jgi:hypothetical protein
MFVGMVRSGSPSLHAILEESASEDNSTLSDGRKLWLSYPLGLQRGDLGCPHRNYTTVGGHPMLQTIPTVPQRTAIPQPSTKLLPEWLWVNQEEQQHVLQADIERRAA